ncbi:hypothetical protein J3F84DRAFT_258443 [Trichoderma pleuroticola]
MHHARFPTFYTRVFLTRYQLQTNSSPNPKHPACAQQPKSKARKPQQKKNNIRSQFLIIMIKKHLFFCTLGISAKDFIFPSLFTLSRLLTLIFAQPRAREPPQNRHIRAGPVHVQPRPPRKRLSYPPPYLLSARRGIQLPVFPLCIWLPLPLPLKANHRKHHFIM